MIFSFKTLKANSPMFAFYYKNVTGPSRPGIARSPSRSRRRTTANCPRSSARCRCCLSIGGTEPGPNGAKRDVTQTTLEPPLGSGPYRLKSFEAGRTAVYERVADYWGRDLNVNTGRYNFDEIRYEYFRDSTVLLEAFKGDRYDFRTENIARNWATAYDFPAAREGRVVKEEFPIRSTGIMQALCSTPGATSSRTSGCGAPSISPSISRNSTGPCSTACTSGSIRTSSERSSHRRACPKARNWRSSRACATRCRRRSSPTPTRTRSTAGRKPCAATCVRRSA